MRRFIKQRLQIVQLSQFISETYFYEYFKKRTGQSPTQYITAY